MFIDNNLTTSKYRLAYIISGLLAIGSLAYIYFDKYNMKTCLIICGVMVVAHIVLLLINPSYFSFDDDKDPIVVKHYTAYPLFRRCLSFNIKKKLLHKYTITKSFFGLQKKISITVRGYNKEKQLQEFTYPSFNITALSAEDIELLERTLNKYINANLERISQSK